MNVLVLFEESGKVTDAFIDRGHNAQSVDLLPTRGRHPQRHNQGNVLAWLDMMEAAPSTFDLVIAFPPCTYLCNSGVRWLYEEEGRWDKMHEAGRLFKRLLELPVPRIAVENPVPHKYAKEYMGDATQYIQLYDFGHHETKKTGLWLRGLPPLQPTSDLKAETLAMPYKDRAKVHYHPPGPLRARARSETRQGVADAMADQWGNL